MNNAIFIDILKSNCISIASLIDWISTIKRQPTNG